MIQRLVLPIATSTDDKRDSAPQAQAENLAGFLALAKC